MQWSDVSRTPPARTLRQFAALWAVCFGALACREAFGPGHAGRALAFALLAATVGPLGLVWPRGVRLVYMASMVAAFPVGWAVSRLLLAGIFYGVFTPVALLFKLVGRDALGRRYRPDEPTYWSAKPGPAGPASYLRPY
jgi:hypothetical protein